MPYCTEAEFKARFGDRELAQLLGEGEFAGPKAETGRTYAAAAADADAIIDSYLAMRGGVVLPLSGTMPPRILELGADLTRYELYDDVKDAGSQAGEVSAIVVRRKLAIAFLEKFAKGEVTIPGLVIDPAIIAGTIAYSAKPRVFTDETLAGY